MDFSKYFDALPTDFGCADTVEDYKLLLLYAYNAYFNGDPINTDDCLDGLTYKRKTQNDIDAIYINTNLEENTIEVLYSYFVGNGVFEFGRVTNAIDYITSYLNDMLCRNYFSSQNVKAEERLKDLREQCENKSIIIRVITDYVPNSKEKYDIEKKLEDHYFATKLDLSAYMVNGKELQSLCDSNKEPFEYVKSGSLIVDDPKNQLHFSSNSFVCNISAQSLKDLWDLEGSRGLLAMNLRYYVKSKNIDAKIENSITSDGDNFWYLNNGIIIVCDDYSFHGNVLKLERFSIVNGGQTTRMIGNIPFDKDFYVLCKVVKNEFATTHEKNLFVSKVAEASNTQKPIKAKDMIANRVEQRNLKTMLQENGIFCEIKRGEKCDNSVFPEQWQKTKNNELAQDLFSFVYQEPGPTRNNVSKILESDEKYNKIFVEHSYSFPFLKDLIILEKCYKIYKKKITKDTTVSAMRRGLVKNGQFYCLATIGYILKLLYNSEFYNNIKINRNREIIYKAQSSELAFNHGFIRKDYNYKNFLKISENLFNFVFGTCIEFVFSTARDLNPSLAYSNWTKTDTGYRAVRTLIENNFFDNADRLGIAAAFATYFAQIDQEQMDSNIDMYVDYIKKHGDLKPTDMKGNEISESDTRLRDALMVYTTVNAGKFASKHAKFTDKMLDTIIEKKPQTIDELKPIVKETIAYFFGNDILQIIQENM